MRTKCNKYIYAAIMATGLLMSCSEKKTDDLAEEHHPILLYAAMQPATTRAGVSVQTVQNVRFIKDESVDVFMNENTSGASTYTQPLVYTTTDAGTNGFFSLYRADVINWTSTKQVYVYAYYPHGIVTSFDSNTAFSFSIQTDQSTDAKYRQSDLMEGEPASQPATEASTAGIIRLTFTHLLSKVVITLKGDRSLNINHEGWRDGATEEQQRAAQIEANNRLVGARVDLVGISPSTTITAKRANPKQLGTASGTATNVYVGTIASSSELMDDADATSAWQIACIIPPQTKAAGAQMIKITMSDGGVLYYKPAALCTFTSGHVNTYNITVHAKELTLTGSSIDPWTVGDTDQGHEAQPVITL